MARIVDFADGFISSVAPSITFNPATEFKQFASDAEFVSSKGSVASSGDVYFNTTDNVVRYHDGTSWQEVANKEQLDSVQGELEAEIADNTSDIATVSAGLAAHTSATSNAHVASAISNTPGGNLSATNVQTALNELQSDVDTRATSSALTSHSSTSTGVHGVSGSVVGTTSVQTLTNKTISADDNDIIVNAASVISNSLNGALNEVASNLNNHALETQTHGVNGDIVGTTDTQRLTNKDIDGVTASNSSRITLPKASKTTLDALTRKQGAIVFDTTSLKPYYDDGTTLKVIGSGGGGKNFVTNSDADASTAGWSAYADAAGTSPVDGTGGSPTVTWTTSSSSPLSGNNSFIFTHPASNTQGQGVSYDFSIDSGYQAKTLTLSFLYKVDSGTFVAGNPSDKTSAGDSSVTVWIYDVTNSVLIQPSAYRLNSNSSSVTDTFTAQFQSASNSTSYRLIIHNGATATSAFTLKFDDISVAPTNYIYGSPITDLKDYGTITIGATTTAPTKGTIANDRIQAGRIGDNWRVRGEYKQTSAGTAGSGDYLFTLPNGLRFDSSKVSFYTGGAATSVNFSPISLGSAEASDGSAYNIFGNVIPYDATRFRIFGFYTNGTAYNRAFLSTNGVASLGTAFSVSFDFQAPMLGYSSSVQMSDSADTRVVAARATITSAVSTTAGNPFNFNNIEYDTHGAITTGATTWKYTAPVSGYYKVSTGTNISAGNAIIVYKNGTSYALIGQTNAALSTCGTTEVYLNTGDYIDIRGTITGTPIAGASPTLAATNWVTVERLSGPSAIAATETIAASYWCSANVSASTTQPINFDSKEYDTHGAVTTGATWRFTAPAAGLYNIGGLQAITTSTAYVQIYKNGSKYKTICYVGGSIPTCPNLDIRLNAGDYIDIRPNGTPTYQGGLLNGDGVSNISIKRIGL